MKMNLLSVLLIILCVCFAEINCKSIHVHDDFNSDFEVSGGNSLNRKHDSKSKVSWIKLKPILHREIQHVRYVKGTESTTLSAENTHPIPNKNEEASSKSLLLTENEDVSFNGEAQNSNNIIKTDIKDDMKDNLTIKPTGYSNMIKEIVSNNTNIETPESDLLLKKNDFPYNITPDIMNQNGDLIVFLALNENGNKINNLEYNETGLGNEGTTVTLEEISTTGLELLKDFQTQENLIDIKFPSAEETLIADNNLTNLKTDFNVDNLEMNRNDDKVEKIEETSMSEISEINNEKSENLNNEQNTKYSSRDDHLQQTSSENSIKDYKSDKKKFQPDSTLTSTQSDMKVLQANSDERSNASDTALKRSNIFENVNNEPHHINSLKDDDKLTKVSIKREGNSKCPDPGLCIFWFLALDTCEEDSHCFGSLICCTWGCSKMCMDIDGETP